jgi:hypothetical protein
MLTKQMFTTQIPNNVKNRTTFARDKNKGIQFRDYFNMKQVFWTFFCIFFIFSQAKAQFRTDGIIIGANFGISKLTTETSSDFSENIAEFNKKNSACFDIELSKLMFNHFEIGTNLFFSKLKGDDYNTEELSAFSIFQSTHPTITDATPLMYENKLFGQKLFLGYYFRSFSKLTGLYNIEPFIRGGIGYSFSSPKLKYANSTGQWNDGKSYDLYNDKIKISPVYSLGGGVKAYLKSNLAINLSLTFNYTTTDYLDVVHNYNTDGTSANMNGIFSEFKFGILYQIHPKRDKQKKTKISKQALSKVGSFLPFSGV